MIQVRRVQLAVCVLCLIVPGFARAQQTKQSPPPAAADSLLLSVTGEVERALKLSTADFAKLPRRTVRAKEHNGKEATFEGVELVELLRLAGVKFGEQLRGPSLATFLVVEAADGYQAVFALPELDPAFTDRVILLADRRDGKPLSESEGKLRVIIPDEKKHARWVQQVVALTIRRA